MRFMSLSVSPTNVNSWRNPRIRGLKKILQSTAKTYKAKLVELTVDHGLVVFKFDREDIIFDAMEYIKDNVGIYPSVYNKGSAGPAGTLQGLRKVVK